MCPVAMHGPWHWHTAGWRQGPLPVPSTPARTPPLLCFQHPAPPCPADPPLQEPMMHARAGNDSLLSILCTCVYLGLKVCGAAYNPMRACLPACLPCCCPCLALRGCRPRPLPLYPAASGTRAARLPCNPCLACWWRVWATCEPMAGIPLPACHALQMCEGPQVQLPAVQHAHCHQPHPHSLGGGERAGPPGWPACGQDVNGRVLGLGV